MAKSSKLLVRELPSDEDDLWSDFVRTSPSGSAYSRHSYLDALCVAAGGESLVLAAFRGDELAGGVGVYEHPSRAGTLVAPRLLLYYNGFVLRDYDTKYPSERSAREVETITALAAALSRRGYARLELRSRDAVKDGRPLLLHGWRVEPTYSFVVPLADLDAQWNRIERNLRRLVERAQASGLMLEVDGEFDAFYDLHAETHERKGAPLYLEREAFRRYHAQLSEAGLCHLFHARLPNGQVAASQLVLVGHPVTHTVSAATAAAHQNVGASPFLRWHVFKWLAANGYAANDLTDATLGSVSHFKSQLGADLTTSLVASRPESARFRALAAARRLLGRGG